MRRRIVLCVAVVVAAAAGLGFAFSGSATTIADGVRIDGVDVGGMRAGDARALLERRSSALAKRPADFVAGGRSFRISPYELGVEPDWRAAVDDARRQGDGFGPLRGFRRLDVSFFGADVTPPVTVMRGALQYELRRIAQRVDRPARAAAVARRGLRVAVVPARPGAELDRAAAAEAIVERLASLHPAAGPVRLPLRTTRPSVRGAALARAARQARLALSAPVTLALGETRWVVPRYRLAQVLELPAGGRTRLRVGGPAAQTWLRRLGARVQHPPQDATFAVDGSHVRVVPARSGTRLDAAATADALLRAALRPRARLAQVAVVEQPATLTTARAQAMHITGVVGTYTTIYGGIPNRIHNVQLVAHLIDGTLIAPGTTFSFNKTTGARNAAKGFLEAPVIVNGELTTGLGGGVCQVSTTVFNAAFEAGVKITDRTNHALYISHYPQGRDATVDYPDVDLKFVNDTGHWLLLRTFVGSDALTVGLYGTPTGRKVVSTTAPLVVLGPPPVQKTVDPTLRPGETVVDDPGESAMSTSVTRDVYRPDGTLLYHDVWYSRYVASPELVRVGPKKKQKPATTKKTPATPPQTG